VIGFPQTCAQHLLSAKDIERKIAIAVVVAVEESAFLFAVQRQVGGVDIEHNLLGGLGVGLEEHVHHEFIHRLFPECDLLVAILYARAQFHAVQRALACQRLLQLFPSRKDAEHRIVAQLLMVVEILIAQRQTVDSLREHLLNRMLDLVLIPAVEKTFCQAREQVQALIGLAQQERAAIGTDRPAVEPGHDFPSSGGFKSEAGLVTLCHSEGRPFFGSNCCVETQLCHEGRPFANSLVRNAG
jgi:hypothetical protein